MNFTLQKPDDSPIKLNLVLECSTPSNSSCNFFIDFGVELDECPTLTFNVNGTFANNVCEYSIPQYQARNLSYNYEQTFNAADVRVFGDVRRLRFASDSNITTVYRFGDLNYQFVSNMFKSSLVENIIGESDFSQVESMSSMFYGASSLTELDVSNWDVSQVERMGNMFHSASSLTELDVSEWDVSQVNIMSNMFRGASSLRELDVSGWDVSQVESMYGMFSEASRLTELDVSGWDVGQVENMSAMFYGASSLTELDVSEWIFTENQYDVLKVGMDSLRQEAGVYLGAKDWSFILDESGNRTVLEDNDLYCEMVDSDGQSINQGLGCVQE